MFALAPSADDGWWFGFNLVAEAWKKDALCVEYPNVEFFPARGESSQQAKDVCARCLVQRECLTLALEHDLRDGIFGATSSLDRERMRKGGVSLAGAWQATESRMQKERRLDAEHRDDELDDYTVWFSCRSDGGCRAARPTIQAIGITRRKHAGRRLLTLAPLPVAVLEDVT